MDVGSGIYGDREARVSWGNGGGVAETLLFGKRAKNDNNTVVIRTGRMLKIVK